MKRFLSLTLLLAFVSSAVLLSGCKEDASEVVTVNLIPVLSNGQRIPGAQVYVYATLADVTNKTNAIASGVSDGNGVASFTKFNNAAITPGLYYAYCAKYNGGTTPQYVSKGSVGASFTVTSDYKTFHLTLDMEQP